MKRLLTWIGAAATAAFLWKWGYNVAARERATWAPVIPKEPDYRFWPSAPFGVSPGTTWTPKPNSTITYGGNN